MAKQKFKTEDVSTGIGTFSFPKVFKETAGKNDEGETVYNIQLIIPKSDTETIKAIHKAVKSVAQDRWGDNWDKVRHPLRDGDAEKDELTENGQTKGDVYPERLGCFFINASSKRPVGVYDRNLDPILESGDLYAGSKGKLAINFYSYATRGNQGVAAGLNGVQKTGEGEPLGGGGKPAVESMFDIIEGDDDEGIHEATEKKSKKDKKKSKKG